VAGPFFDAVGGWGSFSCPFSLVGSNSNAGCKYSPHPVEPTPVSNFYFLAGRCSLRTLCRLLQSRQSIRYSPCNCRLPKCSQRDSSHPRADLPQNHRGGEISHYATRLRRRSQAGKKRRVAPFEMMVGCGCAVMSEPDQSRDRCRSDPQRRGGRQKERWRGPDRVALRWNQRPRQTLGFQTPASKLHASVASTV
jgi:hypothetical protein